MLTNQFTQNPFLAQSTFGVPQQQAFAGQNLQSSQNLQSGQNFRPMGAVSNYAPTTNAWSYRLQPVSNAGNFNNMNTGTIQQQPGAIQQQGGQFVQNAQAGYTTASNAMMPQQLSTGIISPNVDISETKNDIIVACNLPNVNVNNLNLTATENSLSISAQAFAGNQSSGIHRTVPLSTTIRAEAIDANYSNGILEVRMPKKEGTSNRQQLQVNVGE